MHTFLKPTAVVAACLAVSGAYCASNGWLTSWDQASRISQKTGKPILADFTGSDWCHWCIVMHKEIFDSPVFKKWADKNVVLLELDYPRRTPQPAQLRDQNASMLKKYPYVIGYPTVLFLHADGKAFGQYGYDQGGPEHWIEFAERLLKPKTTQRPLRFAGGDDTGYPVAVEKNLYAGKDLRGKHAPKLTVQNWLSGVAPKTKGKVVLIDFWATWCPSCRDLIPEMNGWKKEFSKDLVIIGVTNEKPGVVRKFIKQNPIAYNIGLDSKGTTAAAIDVAALPHAIVVTPDGIVRWQGYPGANQDPLTEQTLKQIIDASKRQGR